ncbi:MAG: hypothetical protein SFV51_31110 [Bryobacteraceae bacterium]|nr:hypothetical protein [Bryobacteraceae bacterium]
MRIFALLAAAGVLAAEPKLVWRGPNVTLLGGPSKDGAWLSYVDSGELAVRDLHSDRTVFLTRKAAGSKEFAYFSVISRDAKRVAYAWFNDRGFYELRAANLDGTAVEVLYSNEEAGFVQPCAWTPDGKQILTLLFRKDNISQIVMMPSEGGAPLVLRSLNWVYPKRMDLSPDGRHIVYDSFASDDTGDRTIFLLSVDGTKETKLISERGNHLFPLWTPDGKGIVFASDSGNGMSARILEMADGKPAGRPRELAANLGRFVPLGITSSGGYYYGLRSGGTDVYVSGNARPVSMRFPDRNRAPAWSPDGRWLAYLSRRGSENFGQESRVIVLRSVQGGEEKEVGAKLAHLESLSWSPDGKAIVVRGSDRQGRGGLYRVDIETGGTKALVWDEAAGFRGLDGGLPAYLKGDELRTTESVLATCEKGRAFAADGSRFAALCGKRSIVSYIDGKTRTWEAPVADPMELAWVPGADAFVVGDGRQLWRVPFEGAAEKLDLPEDRIPGISVHPNGKAIAYTAGSAQSEIWCLQLGK